MIFLSTMLPEARTAGKFRTSMIIGVTASIHVRRLHVDDPVSADCQMVVSKRAIPFQTPERRLEAD